MSQSFEDAITWEELDDGRFRNTIDASWFQGPGVFGGITAASIVRGLQRRFGLERRVRTLTLHFLAPMTDAPAEMTLREERAGGRVTHVTARIAQGGDAVVVASATLGAARPQGLELTQVTMPLVDPPESVPRAPSEAPIFPNFGGHVDFRFLHGVPYSGVEAASSGGWCRLREPHAPDTAYLAALADVWPPAVLATFDGPRAATSVDFTLHFVEPTPVEGIADDAFYYFEHRAGRVVEGYAQQRGELWSEDGRLLVTVRQLVAVL